MKSIIRFLLVPLLVFGNCNLLFSQWVQTNGPYGGHIRCLAIDGNNLLAGTSTFGVFVSTNNGANWKAVDTEMSSYSISAVFINDTNF